MAQRLFVCLLCAFSSLLSGQEVLTTAYFPEPGDTLRTNVATLDYAAAQEYQLAGGANLRWVFDDPEVLFQSTNPVTVSEDPRFPTAELLVTEDLFTLNYFRIDSNVLNLVGISSRLPILPSFEIASPVDPTRPIRRAGLQLGQEFSSTTENSVTISPDSIPPEAQALIGLELLSSVDSMRITTISNRQDSVDAFGVVELDGRSYSTIRERRREFAYIRLELKRGRLPFIDVTETVQVIEPSLAGFLGEQDTIDTYLWWNNESKEPIVEVGVNTVGGVTEFRYKRPLQSTSTGGPLLSRARVNLYPNPAHDYVNYELAGLTRGRYVVAVVNMLGQRVMRRDFTAIGDQTRLTLDLHGLRGGQYLVSLTNERGRIVSTRKLLVR